MLKTALSRFAVLLVKIRLAKVPFLSIAQRDYFFLSRTVRAAAMSGVSIFPAIHLKNIVYMTFSEPLPPQFRGIP